MKPDLKISIYKILIKCQKLFKLINKEIELLNNSKENKTKLISLITINMNKA